jgi:hypothetical protein
MKLFVIVKHTKLHFSSFLVLLSASFRVERWSKNGKLSFYLKHAKPFAIIKFFVVSSANFKVYRWRESVKLSIFVKHGKFSIFLCCCITMLVCKNELHILHCCISNYKFALLHWFVGESYTCYVVEFELLVATFLSFWLLHCYILTFNLSGFPFLFFPFN